MKRAMTPTVLLATAMLLAGCAGADDAVSSNEPTTRATSTTVAPATPAATPTPAPEPAEQTAVLERAGAATGLDLVSLSSRSTVPPALVSGETDGSVLVWYEKGTLTRAQFSAWLAEQEIAAGWIDFAASEVDNIWGTSDAAVGKTTSDESAGIVYDDEGELDSVQVWWS